ncbi:MAG: multiple sugar transport system ATP-binding protein [Gaiellaceae bacterium]|nr:multiple sugar transport system ATP-binding protein [Gaiellaceae bacterium]
MGEIRFDRVSKEYGGGVLAVRDLSLEVGEGEFMVLVGPSGCGKTTALRMVAGLEEITEGEIRIAGRVVNDLAPRERDIAMVFQSYALYPHKTVFDNIAFGLRMRKVPKAERQRRVEEIAGILGLTDFLHRRPAHLSGGQRQRVAMGRAIVREPAAFLMDEPLSNLDAKLRVQMRAEIARIQKSLKVTTLYVTHDQIEAMTMGDRVAVMSDGVLQQVATPSHLYDTPRNLFVASFVGSPPMNLIEAEIERDNGTLVCRLRDGVLELPAERPALDAYVGRRVAVGIRPEHVRDASLAPEGARLNGRAVLVEELGAELLAHVEVAATPLGRLDLVDAASLAADGLDALTRSATLLGRFPRESGVVADEPIEVTIDTRRLHFFDLETGDAIQAVAAPVPATVER